MKPTLDEVRDAAGLVYQHMLPTPQHEWPLLAEVTGARVWVKHENHTPTASFKVRGGITFIDWLKRTHPSCPGVITATRGNHGLSLARACREAGLRAVIYVPHGNSTVKNAGMRAFGADVVEAGDDFDAARLEMERSAAASGLFRVPPYHVELVKGVATYALELFGAVADLDAVYVPIGGGSGIAGTIAVRDGLGLQAEVVAVVSDAAQSAILSAEAGRMVEVASARTIADGMAVRVPVPEACAIYAGGAARFVSVSDAEVAAAMRLYFTATANVAEGAGAAALAGLMQERGQMRGKRVGVILTGGCVDPDWFATVLAGCVPTVR